jgi:hypothetical protein
MPRSGRLALAVYPDFFGDLNDFLAMSPGWDDELSFSMVQTSEKTGQAAKAFRPGFLIRFKFYDLRLGICDLSTFEKFEAQKRLLGK